MVVSAYVVPGYNHACLLTLVGEDGRQLAEQKLELYTESKWGYFYWELPFEANGVGELGRLTVSTQDQYGRLTSAYSLHLLLLAEGTSILNPPDVSTERFILEQPTAKVRISGGDISVTGRMRPFNNLPIVVELIGRDLNVLGSQSVVVSPAVDGGYVPFHADVPYSISKGAWALLVVRQADDRIDGLMYLYSQEFFLNP